MSLDAGRLLPCADESVASRVLLIAAHPDDETIGAGALLSRLDDVRVVIVTDGAPLDPVWWGDPTQSSREAYAARRADELRQAMACVGLSAGRLHLLGLIDQQASNDLAALTVRVLELVRRYQPDVLLTHPYEGGHPDHDACAFAVSAALRLLKARPAGEPSDAPRALPFEFTSYHARSDGSFVSGEFLDVRPGDVINLHPTAEERIVKRRMLECYASQRATLSGFKAETERFRPAPPYDFTRPPHDGPLHYERFNWGITGPEWRTMARDALTALGLRHAPAIEEVGSR